MYRSLFCFTNKKSLSFISTLVLISFLTIGGCSQNNGGGGIDAPGPDAGCIALDQPCTSTTRNANGTAECKLDRTVCAVDLDKLVAEIILELGLVPNDDSVMWIEAWGGRGASGNKGGSDGGDEGYAVTTTSVNDIKGKNNGSSVIYYFLGENGALGAVHCGGGGGTATIITTEDLALNPTSDPTQSAPPVLLVAGAGGGGAGNNKSFGCVGGPQSGTSGAGGSAFATNIDGQGPGGPSLDSSGDKLAKGGNENGMGVGGASSGTSQNGTNPTSGSEGFGGIGGAGGNGQGCTSPGVNGFINQPPGVSIKFSAGEGGTGGSDGKSCTEGGGGGGGGYGGGGGGVHGNDSRASVSGAGGGSFAIQSTKGSVLAPTTKQSNPCGTDSCVRITFVID